MTNNTFTVIDQDNNETTYEILVAFKWLKTNKNYLVYTDNTKNKEGSLNVFASIYYPDDDSKLDEVETEEEWQEIEKRLNDMRGVE